MIPHPHLPNLTEAFVLCQNYSPPEGYVPTIIHPMLDLGYCMSLSILSRE